MTASAFAKPLGSTLTCHAWSGDGKQVAVSPNNEEIHIYETSRSSPSGWERIHVLSQHEQAVSALDWAPGSGQLLSCSHDRNAFVWTLQPQHDRDSGGSKGAQWLPEMVIIKHDRAALAVRWSPCERKFAVGSGAKSVCVCHFDKGLNWWGSSVVRRKHGSSVVSVAWHPSSALLATASTDFKCRVFNARVPGIDHDDSGAGGAFGDLVYEVDCGGCWAHGVAWSPSGASLAASTHRSSVIVAQGFPSTLMAAKEEEEGTPSSSVASSAVALRSLPLKSVVFLSEGLLVGAGFDGQLVLIGRKDKKSSGAAEGSSSGGGGAPWAVLQTLSSSGTAAEGPQKAGGDEGPSAASSSAFSDRIRMFQSKEQQPGAPARDAPSSGAATKAPTAAAAAIHCDAVVELRRVPQGPRQGHGSSANPALISSCGRDGRIGLWDLSNWTD